MLKQADSRGVDVNLSLCGTGIAIQCLTKFLGKFTQLGIAVKKQQYSQTKEQSSADIHFVIFFIG
ncbi:MAG: hypothetical protein AAF487_14720 [Bacteroidota bacterium]